MNDEQETAQKKAKYKTSRKELRKAIRESKWNFFKELCENVKINLTIVTEGEHLPKDIASITDNELTIACQKVGAKKALRLDGILNVALKAR